MPMPDPTVPNDVRLEPFGLADRDQHMASAAVLAELHSELLPTSPAVRLGPHFLRDFYYTVLPEEFLIFGFVAVEAAQPVGFAVATRDSNGYLSTALRRRGASVAKVLVRHPPPPRALWSAVRLGGDRRPAGTGPVAELLSLGVRAADQRGIRAGSSRRRLARLLMESVTAELDGQPVIALVDETNGPARLMYADLGWTMDGRVTAGWPVPQLVYRRQAPN
jgi:hypothetical protein